MKYELLALIFFKWNCKLRRQFNKNFHKKNSNYRFDIDCLRAERKRRKITNVCYYKPGNQLLDTSVIMFLQTSGQTRKMKVNLYILRDSEKKKEQDAQLAAE